jgi:LacI family transcriptional regulator
VKVTSFDVARRAQVSQPTVSRALRNLPGTSPETRRRVQAAAEELGYVVSETGRNLSTRKTRRIAVVSDELTNPFYPQLVEPTRRYLADQGLGMVVVADTKRSSVTAEVLADGSYDGVILTTTTRNSSLPSDLSARGIPYVLANRVIDDPTSFSCTVDNKSGAEAVVGLLLSLGHRRIGSIQGPVNTSTGRDRAAATASSLRRRGMTQPRELTVRVLFEHDAAHAAASTMLAVPSPPTAVVCGNDVIAMGVLSAARELDVDVPGELTVVGFDDIPMAGWPIVNLTTVRSDLDGLARTAVGLLCRQLEEPFASPETSILPVQLVERGTHGHPVR